MKTKPLYLEDPYLKTSKATILSIDKEDEKTFRVCFDQTIFYPMGGGQPTDQGFIMLDNGERFDVFQVMIKDDEINHYIKLHDSHEALETKGSMPKVGMEVILEIDWQRRYKNMKVHTGGHILDYAVHKLGLTPNKLKPLKGDHGKKPFVMYEGNIDFTEDELKEKLQLEINDLINKNLEFSWEFTTLQLLEKDAIYLQPNLPINKPLRKLTLEGIGSVADGGTIAKKTGEIGKLVLTKVEISENQVKISYKIESEDKKDEVQLNNKKQESSMNNEGETNNKHSSELGKLLENVKDSVENLNTEEELTELWREYLGKKGYIRDAMSRISEVPNEEKASYGQTVNQIKNKIDELINSKKENIQNKKNNEYLNKNITKLTSNKPKVGHLHPLTETINDLNRILGRIGYSVYDGPEIETYEYNFKRCNVPEDHPAMDLQDSIYIKEPNILLRTQTSSMEAHALEDLKPPFKIIMPGRTFRNEKVNASNHFIFHQYQLVCVQKKVSLVDLIGTIDYVFKSYLGEDVVTRYRNKYYPEVEPGVGPDMQCFNCKGDGCNICKHRGWMEMGGAGIIHPNIMRMAGLDTNEWQGFAFGLGLDRWAMAKHNIKDIRTLLGGSLAYKPNVR
ncbi:MAG: hypothetical protein Q9M91_04790 [Candidatus Dojkabacteria bacterium]|nr:hypothetical protein [Candidatus Dojkabacteria bacterium]MDQ7021125.1 hypothetical protein [Candidatus Dojkabacteria bacterium]